MAFAVPLCRAAGITTDERSARRLGRAIAVIDAFGVAAVLTSSAKTSQRRAALANTTIDALGAVVLLVLAIRRSGRERMVSTSAAAFLLGGGIAWVRAAGSVR